MGENMSNEKLDLILKKLVKIEDEQQEMKSGISEIKETLERLDDIEKKTNAIMEQVAKNAENITEIRSNQETISNIINQMASLQKQQDETINILARRSIDQEAELRKIK